MSFVSEPNFCYGRSNRLSGKEAFQLVFRKGSKRVADSFLSYHVKRLPNSCPEAAQINKRKYDDRNTPNVGGPRLGIQIKKKYVKKAVTRNKIKRIIRESFRCKKNNTSIAGLDIIVTVISECASKQPIHELRSNIDRLWVIIAKYQKS